MLKGYTVLNILGLTLISEFWKCIYRMGYAGIIARVIIEWDD